MARGERVGDAYVRIHASGEGMDKEIRDMFDDQDPNFREGGRRNSKAYTEAFAKEMGSAPNQTRLRRSLTDALAKGDFLEQSFFRSKNWTGFRSGLIKEFGDAGRLAGDNLESEMLRGMTFDELDDRLDNITRDISNAQRQLAGANNETAQSVDRITEAIRDEGNEVNETDRKVDRHHNTLHKLNDTIGNLADNVGKAFGRGSRNDFLNFTGGLARGMVNLLSVIPRVALGLASVADNAREAFRQSILNGGSTFRATLAGIASVAETSGAALIALAAAAAGLVVIVGPLVALMSLLVGAITALAGTVVFGLIGALGALAGVAGVAGAGIAVLITALRATDWTVLGERVGDLGDKFSELGQVASRRLFADVEQQAKRLSPVLDGLRTPIARIATAISSVGDSWLDALNSSGFQAFRDEMTNFLPSAVSSLGRSIGNALGGLGGIFRAAIPLTQEFLGWLEDITGEFGHWASTAAGQEAIKDFLDRAAESAKSLGRFLLSATDFLLDLLDKGRDTGDSIFDTMADALERLTSWLDTHPDALSNWFDDSEELVRNIGKVIGAIATLVDALDNAGTRAAANTMVVVLARVFRGLGRIVETTVNLITRAVRGLRNIFSGDAGAQRMAARIGGAFAGVAARIGRAFGTIPGIVAAVVNRLPGIARAAANRIGPMFAGVAGRVRAFLTTIPAVVNAIMGRLPGIARTAANRVGSAFSGVQGRIRSLVAGIPGMVNGILSRLQGIARTAANRTGSAFSGVQGRIRGLLDGIPGMVSGLLNRLPGIARTAASGIGSAFSGVAGRVRGFLDGLPGAMASIGNNMVSAAADIPGRIASLFSGLAGRIISAVGTIHLPTPTINMPNIPRINIPGLAAGGIEQGAYGIGVIRRIAEAGPEAVVPLHRPLAEVDPSVRWLSAIAQGKIPGMAAGGTVGTGKSISIAEGAITVITPSSDSRAVATQLVNQIVATGY